MVFNPGHLECSGNHRRASKFRTLHNKRQGDGQRKTDQGDQEGVARDEGGASRRESSQVVEVQ